jgi:hypothetical protein
MIGTNYPIDLGKNMEFHVVMMGNNTILKSILKSIYPPSYLGIPVVGR